jgi:flagellar protein FliS
MSTYSQAEREYQVAALHSASSVRLVIMLYDILLKDIGAFSLAIATHDYEAQTKAIKHGLLVLLQLEGSLNMEAGGKCAQSLSQFYSVLRSMLTEAQILQDRAVLDRAAALIQEVRSAWEQVDARQVTSPPPSKPIFSDDTQRHTGNSWSV